MGDTVLSDDVYFVRLRYEDNRGGISQYSSVTTFTVDTIAPATPVCSTSPSPANNGTLVITTCTGVETGAVITIPNMSCGIESGNEVVCTGTVGVAGGEISVANDTVTIADGVGNINTTATTNLVIDNVSPSTPTITAPTNGSPVIGAAEAGSTVVVTTTSGATCTTIANASGDYSCVLSPAPVNNEDVQAVATDTAGNSSPVTTEVSGIDTQAPSVLGAPTVVDAPLTNNTTPVVNGTCVNGDTITVQVGGSNITPTTVCTGGIYTITPAAALADGIYNITVTATDPVGNVSALSPSVTIEIDTTAPVGSATLISPSAITNNVNDVLQGSCGLDAANGNVSITTTPANGFVLYPATTTIDGNGEFSIPVT